MPWLVKMFVHCSTVQGRIVLQMKKLRVKEIKWPAEGHRGSQMTEPGLELISANFKASTFIQSLLSKMEFDTE